MPRPKSKINIYHYNDYRALIKALITHRKEMKLPFSFRWFAQKAGFSSPNFLQLVVTGKRHLSPTSMEKVAQIFQLNQQESDFFYTLIGFNKAKTHTRKELYAQKLSSFQKQMKVKPLAESQFEYYSKWYYPAIREMLLLQKTPQTTDWISKNLFPKIPQAEVEKALKVLESLQLINIDSKGKIQVLNETISSGDQVSNTAIISYHKNVMNLAFNSIYQVPASKRDISAVTIALSSKNHVIAIEKIQNFRKELLLLAENDKDKNNVYQLNMQFFPLTHLEKKDQT